MLAQAAAQQAVPVVMLAQAATEVEQGMVAGQELRTAARVRPLTALASRAWNFSSAMSCRLIPARH